MKMYCLHYFQFSSFFSNRLQEVSNTLINHLTMLNKMVTNVFRSVCFAIGPKQLKSPFCLASFHILSFPFSHTHYLLISHIIILHFKSSSNGNGRSTDVCPWYVRKLISRDYFLYQQESIFES